LACSTSDVITCDQNWRHLPSSSAVAKDLSSNTEIRVTESIECEIFINCFKNLSEKLGAKFTCTTLGYSVQRTSRLNDAFMEILELKAGPVVGQQLRQKN